MNDFKDNSWNDKPRRKALRYNGPALNEEIQRLPGGAPRMAALREAIAQADRQEDHRWRLFFRRSEERRGGKECRTTGFSGGGRAE